MTDIDYTEKEKSREVHGTVEFLMLRMRHKGDLPAFSRHIAEINSKLASLTAINYSSVGDLAQIILQDFSLTNKLLKVVNSALYSTLSGKVTTISKAIFLLGFDKVRMISAALLVFDHLQNKAQAKELKEMAVASFMSGLIAAGVAETTKRGEKEEAFICAMLHNLGKMLVICYLPEEYEEIKNQMDQKGFGEDLASKAVLGVAYSDLGMAVSRSWNFPDKIVRSMEYPPPGVIGPPKTEEEILRIISSYSNELLANVLRAEEVSRAEALSDLSKRYQNSIPFRVEQMETLIDSAVERIDDYSDISRADQTVGAFKKKLIQGRGKQIGESQEVRASVLLPRPSLSVAFDSAGRRREQQSHILMNGIHEIKEIMKSSRDLGDVIYMIIETMYRGFALNRVIFCMRDAAREKMAARFGLGENANELVKHFHFLIGKTSDVFNVAISQAKGIIIDDAAAPNMIRNLPEWYRNIIAVPSFLIYPLMIKSECISMFYADKKEKGILLTEVQKHYMEDLRNMALQAITQKHR